jgi:hypothetical protein
MAKAFQTGGQADPRQTVQTEENFDLFSPCLKPREKSIVAPQEAGANFRLRNFQGAENPRSRQDFFPTGDSRPVLSEICQTLPRPWCGGGF